MMFYLGQTTEVTTKVVEAEPLTWMEQVTRYGQKALDTTMAFAPKVAIAVILGFIGWKAANWLNGRLGRLFDNKRIDPSLRPFLLSLLDAAVKVALAVTLINYLGIPTASFVAVIGAAGLAVGLALSGTLQNFAGGVVLLLVRPFRVGDTIKAQAFEGKVTEIQIFQTILTTPDNLTVYIPNGKLVNESILNYSVKGTRRADLTFGIGYEDDIDQARGIIMKLLEEDARVLSQPAPVVILQNLGDSTVDLQARFWVNFTDHFSASNDLRERVKKAFDREGISFPFPQMDYHMIRRTEEPGS